MALSNAANTPSSFSCSRRRTSTVVAPTSPATHLRQPEQRCLAHALVGMTRQADQRLCNVRTPAQAEKLSGRGNDFGDFALDSGPEQLYRALARRPHGSTICLAQLRQ